MLSFLMLRKSQTLRFAAYERTALVALALRGAPLSLTPHTVAAAERDEAERDLPPLPDGPRRPEADVVVITIDALRADHVGAYGYKRPTTPNIDALARAGTRFARAYAQAPHTSFSVASMLTGKYFPTLARLAPGEIHDPIAAVLRQYGWRTAAFYPPSVFFVDAQKLKAYADNNFNFEYVKFEYLDAERRVDQIIRLLRHRQAAQGVRLGPFLRAARALRDPRQVFLRRRRHRPLRQRDRLRRSRRWGVCSATSRNTGRARSSSSPPITARSSTSTAAATTARRCTTSSCTSR